MKTGLIVAAALTTVFVGFGAIGSITTASKPSQPIASTSTPAERVISDSEMTMTWACESAVKKALNDSASYKYDNIVFTEAQPQDGYLVNGQLTFRAKNGFGGYRVGMAVCGFDALGQLVSGPHILG